MATFVTNRVVDSTVPLTQDKLAPLSATGSTGISGIKVIGEWFRDTVNTTTLLQQNSATWSAVASNINTALITTTGTLCARQLQNRFTDIVNVKDFGAIGDGISDDTAAFQSAFNMVSSIYIPAGTYLLTSKITCTNKPLSIKGAGTNVTKLKWTNADGGINIVNTTTNENLYQVTDLSLLTTRTGGGTALVIDIATNIPEPSIRLSNLNIRGENKTSQWWTVGIDSNNGVVSFYENVYITGQEGTPNPGTRGIVLRQDLGAGAMGVFMNQLHIKFCDIGLYSTMNGSLGIEGVTIFGALIVQCNQCVVIDASQSTYVPPYYAFTSCQFDAVQKECLYLFKLAQIFINDCVFYGEATSSIFPLVNLTQCNDFWINNSYFIDFATPRNRTGIYCLSGTTAGWIGPCTFGNLAQGISFDSTTTGINVAPQQSFGNCIAAWVNTGSNTPPGSFSVPGHINNNRVTVVGSEGAIELTRTDGLPYIDFKDSGGEDFDCRIQQTGRGLRFFTGGNGVSSRMTITSGGNIGIGTAVPYAQIYVDSIGTTYVDPTNNNVANLYINNTANNSSTAHAILGLRTNGDNSGDPFISFDIAGILGWSLGIDNSDSNHFKISSSWNNVANSTRLVINSINGNVTPGVDDSQTLGASGARWSQIWVANGTIQTSDQRDKTNIQPTPLGLNFINNLNPVSYKWTIGSNKVLSADEQGNTVIESIPGERTHHGFIAQDVRNVADSLNTDFGGWVLSDINDPNSQQALRYDQFIAPLVKAVQELSQQNTELRHRIEALENR